MPGCGGRQCFRSPVNGFHDDVTRGRDLVDNKRNGVGAGTTADDNGNGWGIQEAAQAVLFVVVVVVVVVAVAVAIDRTEPSHRHLRLEGLV